MAQDATGKPGENPSTVYTVNDGMKYSYTVRNPLTKMADFDLLTTDLGVLESDVSIQTY